MKTDKRMKQELLTKLKALFSREKKTALLTAVGALGILMILLSEVVPSNKEETAGSVMQQADDAAYNAQYTADLEQDLTEVLQLIDGVGEVTVSVTLESGVRYEYATEGRSSEDSDHLEDGRYATQTSSETSVILVERGGVKEPLILRRVEPTVQGVVIVCTGGGDPAVKEEVVRVACVLCGVRSNRVSVSKTP